MAKACSPAINISTLFCCEALNKRYFPTHLKYIKKKKTCKNCSEISHFSAEHSQLPEPSVRQQKGAMRGGTREGSITYKLENLSSKSAERSEIVRWSTKPYFIAEAAVGICYRRKRPAVRGRGGGILCL